MQCPVVVSMPIRTRMSSICLQIGFLQFCSWHLWGGSFNLSDLNAHSLKMAFFYCPVYMRRELQIQLLMILVLNFSTLSPDSYDSKEEMHCLANSCFTYASVSWDGPCPLSNYFFSGHAAKWHSEGLCFCILSGGGVISCVISFIFSISVQEFLIMPIRILHWKSLQAGS